tara:strand:- start:16625 stop:16867 length:243 start_codon:yes stop_codon:yes gene_type:complete
LIEVFRVAIAGDCEFGFVFCGIWKNDYEVYFFAIVPQVFVDPKQDVFLFFNGFVVYSFDRLIVVLEPVPEGVYFSHDEKV